MPVAIICIDKSDSLDLRLRTRPEHLEWLKQNLPDGTFVGPLLHDDGETFKGSLYILNFNDCEQAREWINQEPYFKNNLFENVIIRLTKNILPLKQTKSSE
ncbi:MAG: YciI family protein [Pseudomonadota bacterium]|nr:YciI family protein [Pseudomonadota bacterium]